MIKVAKAFWSGLTAPSMCKDKKHCKQEKRMRDKMSEDRIDKMIRDSYPASDPISTY